MKIAKLFIKGLKVPFELTQEQGNKAQKIKNREDEYSVLEDSDTVAIADKWTGEVKDIRYVIFETVHEGKKGEKLYSKEQLLEFGDELKEFFLKEGDEEYIEIVDNYVALVADKSRQVTTTPFVRERLEAIRGMDSEEERKNAVERLVIERRVGRLEGLGTLRFLSSRGAVSLNDDGTLKAVKAIVGVDSYPELSNKISQYLTMVSIKEYASDKQLEGYEEMVGEVVDSMEM